MEINKRKQKQHDRVFLKDFVGKRVEIEGKLQCLSKETPVHKDAIVVSNMTVLGKKIDHVIFEKTRRWADFIKREKPKEGEAISLSATVIEYNSQCFTFKKYGFKSARSIKKVKDDGVFKENE